MREAVIMMNCPDVFGGRRRRRRGSRRRGGDSNYLVLPGVRRGLSIARFPHLIQACPNYWRDATMAPTLYTYDPSPYCRAVLLAAKALDVGLNLKTTNLREKEHLKPEFLALNPQHTVPTFVDGDLVLTESRAILTYLSSRYGKNDALYPKDVITRAKIDGLLYFDCSTLSVRMRAVFIPVLYGQVSKPNDDALKSLEEALGWLDGKVALHPDLYLAGTPKPTVADLVIVAVVSTFEAAGLFNASKHSRVAAWLARCKETVQGYKELNEPGALQLGGVIKKGGKV